MSDGFLHEILVACGGPNMFSSSAFAPSSSSSSANGWRREVRREERDREADTPTDRADRRRSRGRRREREEEEDSHTPPSSSSPTTTTISHFHTHLCGESHESLEANRREEKTPPTPAMTDSSFIHLPCSSSSSSLPASPSEGCTYTTRPFHTCRRLDNSQSRLCRREGERLHKGRKRGGGEEEELKLRRVSLEASDISDLGLCALATTMGGRAECVCLKRCTSLSEVGHAALAEHCPNLTSLNLGNCSAVNDLSLASILQNCRSLRTLVLNEARITDHGLEMIGESLGENLLELALHRSEEITNEGVSFLAKSCRNLSLLSLSSCSQVTDAGVCKVAEFCPKLLKLRLDRTRVTDLSIRQVAKSLRRLRYLHLQRCSRVSGEILQYFSVHTHPCLKCIEISRRSHTQITSQHLQLFRKQNRPSTALLLLDSDDPRDAS
ncbi:leucine rich repeat-containing protein [Cystoisospora suis]|uniref:Leucine rich repeat-containing protein n=1 Tax=Cystoisospora suis TaxID=483139 RepID=A0A2C6KTX0_9APIC|nr:leucine rich repeat-containing protein [Cystoisospora suis]